MYEKDKQEMVDRLVTTGYLREEKVIGAMKKVPRHLFVAEEDEKHAYEDHPLPIGEDQTISAPHMVAMMCDALQLKMEHKVLEVGAGTGYHVCVVAQLARKVYALERLEALAERARANLKKAGCEGVKVIVGDGTKGYPEEAPYDRIYVTAGAPEIPKPLLEQLKPGGRLLIPIGRRYSQELILAEKTPEGDIRRKSLGSCAFVPLIGEYGW